MQPNNCYKSVQNLVQSSIPAGYQKYNVVAKKLDRRLVALGADPMLERGLGDDQHPSGYEAALDPWLAQLWVQLRLLTPLPPGVSEVRWCISTSILYMHLTLHSANKTDCFMNFDCVDQYNFRQACPPS